MSSCRGANFGLVSERTPRKSFTRFLCTAFGCSFCITSRARNGGATVVASTRAAGQVDFVKGVLKDRIGNRGPSRRSFVKLSQTQVLLSESADGERGLG